MNELHCLRNEKKIKNVITTKDEIHRYGYLR